MKGFLKKKILKVFNNIGYEDFTSLQTVQTFRRTPVTHLHSSSGLQGIRTAFTHHKYKTINLFSSIYFFQTRSRLFMNSKLFANMYLFVGLIHKSHQNVYHYQTH